MDFKDYSGLFQTIESAWKPPHQYIQDFESFEDYNKWCSDGTIQELEAILSIFKTDKLVPADYLITLVLHIRKKKESLEKIKQHIKQQ